MNFDRIRKYLLLNKTSVALISILIVAIILRFVNYLERFGLAYDQAHDAVIALYAVQNNLIPLVGPFSSAGPFQTGGEWYWFIMTGIILLPFGVISPWIFMTLIYVFFVFLMYKVGEKLFDKSFGLIAAALAAVSTAQIAQGINLTNQGPEAIIGLCAIYFALMWISEKKLVYIFTLGFFVGLGISVHLQAAAACSILVVAYLLGKDWKLKPILYGALGLFLPLTPILIFDLQNDFVNSRNMIQYFLHDQYTIPLEALGRRWLTYALVFWPNAWGHIIGGSIISAYLLMSLLSFSFAVMLVKKKVDTKVLFLVVSFCVMFVVLRYTRTPLFDSYLVFLNPFVLLLSAWVMYCVFKFNKVVGLVLFLIIIACSVKKDISEITYPSEVIKRQTVVWQEKIYQKYPNAQFSFYDYQYKTAGKSLPLVMYVQRNGKTSDTGINIGFTLDATESAKHKNIYQDPQGYFIVELSTRSAQWESINPSSVYNSTENWRKSSR